MNRNGTHVGRPPYTPEERMEASKRQFEDGLTVIAGSDHWHQDRSYFLTPDGRKVRKAKFSMMLAFPHVKFGSKDRIYVQCPDKDCVNPKHLRVVPVIDSDGGMDDRDLMIITADPKFDQESRELARQKMRQHWLDNPIDENHPDVELRMVFFPDPIPDDPAAVRALAADFGIIMAA